MAPSDRTQALVDEAANWAMGQQDLHQKVKPLAEHFAEVSNLMYAEVMVAMAKALEAGIYIGQHGFPKDWGRVPDAFETAFKEEENGPTSQA